MTRAALALAALLVFAARADAATYYVDISCGTSGTGTADTCGGSTGYINSVAGLQTLLSSTVVAGDTVLVRNGTYATTNNGGDTRENGGFAFGHSGTAGNPITLMNYPGHNPVLTNCPLAQTLWCQRPTITAQGEQYIHIKSNTTGTLIVKGAIYLFGISTFPSDSGSQGMVISGVEIYEGWASNAGGGDGNWATLFISGQDGIWIHHNYLHDLDVPSDGASQSSGSAAKFYFNSDVLFEYNTIERVFETDTTSVGGIDDKGSGTRNVYRYNWIEDVFACLRLNSQVNPGVEVAVTDVQFYGNVCIGWPGSEGFTGARLDSAVSSGNAIYSNTFYRFEKAFQNNTLSTDPTITWYNNIFAGGGTTVVENIEMYTYPIFGTPTDYNAWESGERFLHNGTSYANLAAWQATGFDAHSHTTACSFTSAPTDMTLSGGTCTTGGRVGGVIGGATIQQGAYGVTDCVGHTCTDEEPEPPAASGPRRFRMKVKP